MSAGPTLLFVDDDPKAGELLVRFCAARGSYRCQVYRDPVAALEYFDEHGADVVITDLRMPGMDGIELLNRLRGRDTQVPVIIITGHSTVDSAIEALRLGASDFLKKPFDMEELLLAVDQTLERVRLQQENRRLRSQLRSARVQHGIIGRSEAMERVYRLIAKVADVRCNVIIEGESGTGKELAARAVHASSREADRPFVVIDCGGLSDTLLESELFGHEKGAFTGAVAAKPGLFEVVAGGTVFLDEIANISEAMQVKLLRVIQERQVTRVGGVQPIEVDARCVVATNQDLEGLVRAGRFRADLYHRLNVVQIRLPPLRERHGDVPLLASHFVETFARDYRRHVSGFDADSLERMERYAWPGNVRELRNLVERHVVLADAPVLTLEDLPEAAPAAEASHLDRDLPTLAELERRYVLRGLEHCAGSRKKAAATLGIDKSTLWRKLQHYG